MESKASNFNQNGLENSQQTNLIQAALSSGLSVMTAYTTRGQQFLQETTDHRNQWEARKVYKEALSLAFAPGEVVRTINRAGIYEVIVIRPLDKPQMATRTVVARKGIFGLGRKNQEESYIAGVVPMTIGEVKADSKHGEELAVAIDYFATDSDVDLGQYSRFFRGANGRPGNYLSAEIILPASLGDLVADEITANPKFTRELIDAFVRHKHSEDFVKDSWDKYAKPPYQAWDSLPGRKYYFANLIRDPQAK